ncbi:MAG TPA: hypothetical protein VHY36_16050 [Steroidobacteraceae bacterium]|jgi:hypothetical protein|nr:hypothetical protein [Steroidobacteraceae bacterium]
MTPLRYLLLPACVALLLSTPLNAAAETEAPAADSQSNAPPALSAAQQRAVGLVIATAQAAKLPQGTDAFGRVLDPSQLVADAGRLDSSRAAAQAAGAETARLKGLYRGANASLKALQAAEAAEVEAQVRVREAQAELLLRWGPLAQLDDAQRARLIGQLAAGRQLLLRADLPGRHSLGAIPKQALVDVDGVEVPAHVLGPLPQAAQQMQSVGLLLQIVSPPAGLGAGAQLPVMLEGSVLDGCVVPAGALLYGEQGAYVYHLLPDKAKDGDARFASQPVTLVQRVGDGWLVTGLQTGDRIVVRGAGVLWSMQGLGNISDEDTD